MIGFSRNHSGDRFYNPPPIRRLKEQQQKLLEQQEEEQRLRRQEEERQRSSFAKSTVLNLREAEGRVDSDRSLVKLSAGSTPPRLPSGNLDRFLESTTPIVPAQYFSKSSIGGWRNSERETHPYFCLGDLWESFMEWSAYGAGVPLVLNGSDSVVQYYVPYLSGIQLYVDCSKPPFKTRRPGAESDLDSSRETSSDGSDSDIERCIRLGLAGQQNHSESSLRKMNRLSLREKPLNLQEGSSSDDGETANSFLAFEYMERDPPYSREPLADKISVLASQFPEIKTYMSCDLLPCSWISVAWYPIYRIPTGPTLRDLEACFLTFHPLSTSSKGTNNGQQVNHSTMRKIGDSVEMCPKLALPVFGLASYKFKASVWTSNWPTERQQAISLMQAADDWLRNLNVNHPDFMFFASHGTYQW